MERYRSARHQTYLYTRTQQKPWPTLDSHSQSALLYYLDRSHARDILRNAHSAQADIHIDSLLVTLEYDSRKAQREGDTLQAQWLDQMHAEITKAKAIIDKAVRNANPKERQRESK